MDNSMMSADAQHLYERMQADMQKVNNAANFARHITSQVIVHDLLHTPAVEGDAPDAPDAPEVATGLSATAASSTAEMFKSLLDIGMACESCVEELVRAIANKYEDHPALKLERPSNVKPIIRKPH